MTSFLCLNRRNVILFEPAQNLQTNSSVYVHDDENDENNPLRVFYSQKDKHFDVIYTMEKVESLAECQAIVYDILYTGVFKLPDVQYAVEIMLHDQDEQVTLPLEDDPSKYKTQSGEIVEFNDSHDTQCVLKDPKTCHFHNQEDFEEVVNQQKDSITIINRTDDPGRLKIFKPIDGFLYDKTKSCVRQLLDEHITPFPYKVAKALDPSIYRNTEFELWSENRKEQRSKWFDSAEYPMKNLDDKWLYDRRTPYGLRKYNDGKFEAAIVDESAYMALDDDQKKKYVILNPGAEPFNLQQLTSSMDHFVPSKESLEMTVMPAHANYQRGGTRGRARGNRYGGNNYHGNYHHQNSNNPSHNSYQNQHHQYGSGHQTQMPHVGDIERDRSFEQVPEPNQQQQETQDFFNQPPEPQGQLVYQDQYTFEASQVQQQVVYPGPPQSGSWSNMSYVPYPVMGQPIQFAQPMNVWPHGNFTIPPPVPQTQPYLGQGDQLRLFREGELSSTAINWRQRESTETNGSDLPLGDVPTLQFFFNLGTRYFYASGVQRQLESVATQLEGLELNENSCAITEKGQEGAPSKSEQPPVPTNTPVTTKPFGQHRPPGNPSIRRQGCGRGDQLAPGGRDTNGNGYRGWNNNSRKEIKFNSNVKNAHKLDTKPPGNNQGNSVGSQAVFPPLIATSSGNLGDSLSPNAAPMPQFPQISPINNADSYSQYYQQSQTEQFQPQTPQVQHHCYPLTAHSQPFLPPPAGLPMVYSMPDEVGYQLVPVPQYGQQYCEFSAPNAKDDSLNVSLFSVSAAVLPGAGLLHNHTDASDADSSDASSLPCTTSGKSSSSNANSERCKFEPALGPNRLDSF